MLQNLAGQSVSDCPWARSESGRDPRLTDWCDERGLTMRVYIRYNYPFEILIKLESGRAAAGAGCFRVTTCEGGC
jgi:hypothetical protein